MDHHKHSPSSFPMRSRCPQYESGEVGKAAHRGTAMHDAFAKLFESREPTLDLFELDSDNDLEEVKWARDTVQGMTSETWPTEVEVKLSYHDAKFKQLYFGHGDVVNGPNLYDLKTGEQHAYWHQMAGYALALMDAREYKTVNVHLLFSRFKKVQTYTITREQAEPAILDIIARCADPDAPAIPNEFCGWCKKQSVCPAVNERVNAIVAYNDWKLDSYNPDEIAKNPAELSKAIHLSRMMKKWVVAIDALSKTFEDIPGFTWKEVNGRKFITDAFALYEEISLTSGSWPNRPSPKDFIGECSLSMASLEEIIKKGLGLSSKEARSYISKNFATLIGQSKSYKKLQEV
jgi:hypothetical protein